MIYLNNAATSYPKAPGVAHGMEHVLKQLPGHGNRAVFRRDEENLSCRTLLARLLGVADENRIVYTSNATHALNIGILGFPWEPKDIVLTTAAEHNSVLRSLHYLQKKGRLHYEIAPVEPDGRLAPEVLKKLLLKYRPRMLVVTHGSNVTGAINDLPKLISYAKESGTVVFIDASQTAGLYPVLPEIWDADMVALTGHKYLLGPQGTGALYVAPHIELEPVFTGGTGIRSDEEEMPEEMPLRLEAGTQNDSSLSGLKLALAWADQNPVNMTELLDKIYQIEATLTLVGCTVIKVAGARTPVISFTSEKYNPEDIGDILSGSFDIICRTGLHCAPLIFPYLGVSNAGTVRLSLSRFTTADEIKQVTIALKEIFSE